MSSSDKKKPSNASDPSLALLGGRLFDIPEEQFAELVASLESKRVKAAQDDKMQAILGHLRPRLTVARPPRRPTPQRLFCAPFQDLLYDPGTRRKAIGKIPRHALTPIWTVFKGGDVDPVIQTAATALRQVDPDDVETLDTIGAPLWAAGARVLSARLQQAGGRDGRSRLRDELGGDEVLASLEEAAVSLSAAVPLCALRRDLPPGPVADFNRQQITRIAEALTQTAKLNREAIPHVVYVLMQRLSDPSALLGIFEKLTDEGVGDLLGQTGGQVGEAIVSQTEDHLIDVRDATTAEDADKAQVAKRLGRELKALNRTSDAVSGGLGGSGARGLARRIDRVRQEMGRIAEQVVVDDAGKQMLAMIGELDGPTADDADETARMRAIESRITALRLCADYGKEVGLDQEIKAHLKTIEGGLDKRSADLVARLKNNDATLSVTDLYATVRLVELTAGPEKADALRRKGLEAMK